ncbi:hypothetical protein PtB15_6B794 [Puccinia triticina]|nr:hypothetical protein PtB15_6B794 [Puccinia triticina]
MIEKLNTLNGWLVYSTACPDPLLHCGLRWPLLSTVLGSDHLLFTLSRLVLQYATLLLAIVIMASGSREAPRPQTLAFIRSPKAIQPHVQTIVSARKKFEEQMSRIPNQGLVQFSSDPGGRCNNQTSKAPGSEPSLAYFNLTAKLSEQIENVIEKLEQGSQSHPYLPVPASPLSAGLDRVDYILKAIGASAGIARAFEELNLLSNLHPLFLALHHHPISSSFTPFPPLEDCRPHQPAAGRSSKKRRGRGSYARVPSGKPTTTAPVSSCTPAITILPIPSLLSAKKRLVAKQMSRES